MIGIVYFRAAKDKFQSFRLAILPIGDYYPRWLIALKDLGLPQFIPIHYGMFPLADTGYNQSFKELYQAMGVHLVEEERILPLMAGKIGIPVAILDKPGKLNDAEYSEIKNHPAIGATILEPIKAYQDILPLVLHHHEKYDGSGYPDGLKGDVIDIRARILAVADVWDALVSDRPYREGWVQDRARKMIVDGSGSHFDPRVVEAFLVVVADE